MGTAVLPARRRLDIPAWTVAPSALALVFGLLYLVLEPRPGDLAVALAALVPALFLSVAFPEGGSAPFPFSAYLPIPLFCAACLVVLRRDEEALRAGAVLYALGATLAVAFETPMGGTASRLGMLFGGPVLLCAAWDRLRRPSVPMVAVALAGFGLLGYWQWTSAIRDIDKARRW